METVPRKEHPNPQMKRETWLNLNGLWDFQFDFGASGIDRKYYETAEWNQQITVPFCPESVLSGIHYTDFIPMVWYRKTVELCLEQLRGRTLLHFGAVDYESIIWVNGKKAGEHKGGYTSFCLDITALVQPGENEIVVCAKDDNRSGKQPRGKQCEFFDSQGCDYTRTTGIWQTVWLEFVPQKYIKKVEYYPNILENNLTIKAITSGKGVFSAKAFFDGKCCGEAKVKTSGNLTLTVPLSELHLWEVGKGNLYDLELQFEGDCVSSYFGMREIQTEGEKVLLNGKPIFQRLVLDQGFYSDGIYTAPDEESMIRDIEISLQAGFNGARLHQKVFEPRFLYHCDKMGYLVWGEYGSWGIDHSSSSALERFLPEWMEAVDRDFNHPSIIVWCPFNETWDYKGRRQDDNLLKIVWEMTKRYDTTRPCIDTSGHFHVATDLFDMHDYEQDPKALREKYHGFAEGGKLVGTFPERQSPAEEVPVLISEYGGIKWDPEAPDGDGWGYGTGPQTEAEFLERYRGLTDALLDNPHMCGFCYTQLYDVEQERNGLYSYERKPKFDMNVIREINMRKAAMEEIE